MFFFNFQPKDGLLLLSGSYVSNLLNCTFTRTKVNVDSMVFDLRREYYMLYAVGPVSAGIPSFGNILYLEPIKTSITSPPFFKSLYLARKVFTVSILPLNLIDFHFFLYIYPSDFYIWRTSV